MNNNGKPWPFYYQAFFLVGAWSGFFVGCFVCPIMGWILSSITILKITYKVVRFGFIEKEDKKEKNNGR